MTKAGARLVKDLGEQQGSGADLMGEEGRKTFQVQETEQESQGQYGAQDRPGTRRWPVGGVQSQPQAHQPWESLDLPWKGQ